MHHLANHAIMLILTQMAPHINQSDCSICYNYDLMNTISLYSYTDTHQKMGNLELV